MEISTGIACICADIKSSIGGVLISWNIPVVYSCVVREKGFFSVSNITQRVFANVNIACYNDDRFIFGFETLCSSYVLCKNIQRGVIFYD